MDQKASRRSSILKPRKSTNLSFDESLTDQIAIKDAKRVSFASSNFVKQFRLDTEEQTVWDKTYEEEINHTDSPKNEGDTQLPETLDATSLLENEAESFFTLCERTSCRPEEITFTDHIDECDKENYVPVTALTPMIKRDGLKEMNVIGNQNSMLNLEENDHGTMEFTCIRSMTEENQNNHTFNENFDHTVYRNTGSDDCETMQMTCLLPNENNQNAVSSDVNTTILFTCDFTNLITERKIENEELICNNPFGKSKFAQSIPESCAVPKSETNLPLCEDMEFTCGFSRNIIKQVDIISKNCPNEDTSMQFTCVNIDKNRLATCADDDTNMQFTCVNVNRDHLVNFAENKKLISSEKEGLGRDRLPNQNMCEDMEITLAPSNQPEQFDVTADVSMELTEVYTENNRILLPNDLRQKPEISKQNPDVEGENLDYTCTDADSNVKQDQVLQNVSMNFTCQSTQKQTDILQPMCEQNSTIIGNNTFQKNVKPDQILDNVSMNFTCQSTQKQTDILQPMCEQNSRIIGNNTLQKNVKQDQVLVNVSMNFTCQSTQKQTDIVQSMCEQNSTIIGHNILRKNVKQDQVLEDVSMNFTCQSTQKQTDILQSMCEQNSTIIGNNTLQKNVKQDQLLDNVLINFTCQSTQKQTDILQSMCEQNSTIIGNNTLQKNAKQDQVLDNVSMNFMCRSTQKQTDILQSMCEQNSTIKGNNTLQKNVKQDQVLDNVSMNLTCESAQKENVILPSISGQNSKRVKLVNKEPTQYQTRSKIKALEANVIDFVNATTVPKQLVQKSVCIKSESQKSILKESVHCDVQSSQSDSCSIGNDVFTSNKKMCSEGGTIGRNEKKEMNMLDLPNYGNTALTQKLVETTQREKNYELDKQNPSVQSINQNVDITQINVDQNQHLDNDEINSKCGASQKQNDLLHTLSEQDSKRVESVNNEPKQYITRSKSKVPEADIIASISSTVKLPKHSQKSLKSQPHKDSLSVNVKKQINQDVQSSKIGSCSVDNDIFSMNKNKKTYPISEGEKEIATCNLPNYVNIAPSNYEDMENTIKSERQTERFNKTTKFSQKEKKYELSRPYPVVQNISENMDSAQKSIEYISNKDRLRSNLKKQYNPDEQSRVEGNRQVETDHQTHIASSNELSHHEINKIKNFKFSKDLLQIQKEICTNLEKQNRDLESSTKKSKDITSEESTIISTPFNKTYTIKENINQLKVCETNANVENDSAHCQPNISPTNDDLMKNQAPHIAPPSQSLPKSFYNKLREKEEDRPFPIGENENMEICENDNAIGNLTTDFELPESQKGTDDDSFSKILSGHSKHDLLDSTNKYHTYLVEANNISNENVEECENQNNPSDASHNYSFRSSKIIANVQMFLEERVEPFREPISQYLLRQLDEAFNYNFDLPEIVVPELEELEKLENECGESSSSSRLSVEISTNNTNGNNTEENYDIEVPKSLEERVREASLRSEKWWTLAKCVNEYYFLYTHHELVPFRVRVDPHSGVVNDIKTYSNLLENGLPILKYGVKFLQEKIEKEHLLHVLGSKFDILTLLDYICLLMDEVYNFFKEFDELSEKYGKSHRFRINSDFSFTIEILNVKYIIWWIISGDLSIQNLGSINSVKADHKLRDPVDENKIKKILDSTAGPKFIRNFIKNVDEYVKKEGEKIVARRGAFYRSA